MRLRRRIAPAAIALMLLAGCSSTTKSAPTWVEDDVTFVAGLTLHGTYRHRGDTAGPAALLISESGRTDRNGDNNVAGLGLLRNALVGDVEAAGHLHRADPRRGRHAQHLIGDQGSHDPRALRGTKQDFLDDARAGVGIDPDVQAALSEH